jgi:eukaryotic-like serine/threonine-protein kinase
MAPEQLIGSPASRASDIYAAGVVLHECLLGTTPFGADTRVTFIAHKLDLTPSSVPRLSVRPDDTRSALESLIAQMMNPSVDARPQSAADLFERLNALS